MSALEELTALLWWLMLLSATAIILQDIGTAILPKASQSRERGIRRMSPPDDEDEFNNLLKKVKRGLQRPGSFRVLQRDVAQTIAQTALAARGFTLTRVPESRPELVEQLSQDRDIVEFIRRHLFNSDTRKQLIPRSQMLTEFQRTISILEKAESELK